MHHSASARLECDGRADRVFDSSEMRGRLTPSPPPPAARTGGSLSPSRSKSERPGGNVVSPFTGRKKSTRKSTKPTTTMKEFMPHTWQATTAAYSVASRTAPPQIVMDPVALLRQCIRYFSSHPETYGNDIHGLLQQEARHVMRLKASELALVGADPVSFGTHAVTSHDPSHPRGREGLLGAGAQSFLPPLRERPAAAPLGRAFTKKAPSSADDGEEGTFGYGGISFIEPTPGFLALLEGATTSVRDSAGLLRDTSTQALPSSVKGVGLSAELIGWEGTLTAQDITAYSDPRGATDAGADSQAGGEQGDGEVNVLALADPDPMSRTELFDDLSREAQSVHAVSSIQLGGTSLHSGAAPRAQGENSRVSAPPIIVDGAGYETSFLRSQLQQLEAAYNAKSIRMHEMLEENASLTSRLQLAESAAGSRLAAYNTLQTQLDMVKRELDGWKDKANDASQQAAAQANKQSQQSRKAVSTQLAEAKQETAKLTDLWRETERAYQECRRTLENSEKEANHTHDHLSDAFHYIERLERRVARRNQYIDLCLRRQQSMEEKYEKMVWCVRELGTMVGVHSYADALLAADPLWSLVLFARLQCHRGDFAPVPQVPDESPVPGPHTLVFAHTPNGGLLLNDVFEMRAVYAMVTDAVTAAEERRGGVRRLRTNLHGTVACRAARPFLANTIDCLGGEDNIPDSCEVNKRKVPLLTLSSVVLSCTGSDNNLAGAGGVSGQNAQPDVTAQVPNTKQFDQLTLRLLLRQFWKSRLAQYTQAMAERKEEAVARAQRARKQVSLTSEEPSRPAASQSDPANDKDAEEPSLNTFLSALVCFVNRVCTGSPDGHDSTQNSGSSSDAEDPLIAVRIALVRKNEEAGIVDNGRVAFATVDSALVRYPHHAAAAGNTSSGSAPHTAPSAAITQEAADVSPGQARMNRLLSARRPQVGAKAHELLSALYYYALEYKDSDADFRLFYLVSHQLIPEMVGINFYANLQAIEDDLRRVVDERALGTAANISARHSMQAEKEHDAGCADEVCGDETPVDVVARVAHLVDVTPLVGEEVEFDEDSDGEGYGSILPGARMEQDSALMAGPSSGKTSHVHGSRRAPRSRPASTATALASSAGPFQATCLSSASSAPKSSTDTPNDAHTRDAPLRHDIRDYLDTLAHRRNGTTFAPLFEDTAVVENVYAPQLPPGWEALNDRLNRSLAPHEELLRSFKQVANSGNGAAAGLRSQRERREHFRLHTSSQLAAVRGLVPTVDVLRVMQRHAFGTYAVTCCGAPRYSLADALLDGSSTRAEDYADPLDLVGQLPFTSWQLQRLRFALALDQPASLIRPDTLFTVDPHVSTPTHLYDEYLNQTLDLVLRQQRLLVDQLLGACAARHDRYADEGAEECDGQVPVSFLKSGFTALFRSIGLGTEEAYAMVEHLIFYDGLLRLEDEVKCEQFTDAPFMINTMHQEAELRSPARATTTEAGGDAWDVQDEMETCSLLNLIFALRMTYVVWGSQARPFAAKVAELLTTVPIGAELESPHETKKRVNRASSGVAVKEVLSVGHRRGVWSAAVIDRLLEPDEIAECTQLTAKAQYMEAALRVSTGVQGTRNPLRLTLRHRHAEQQKAEEGAQATSAASGNGEVADTATTGTDGQAGAKREGVKDARHNALPQRASRDGPVPAVVSDSIASGAVGAVDRYSAKSLPLSLGLYPELHRLMPPPLAAGGKRPVDAGPSAAHTTTKKAKGATGGNKKTSSAVSAKNSIHGRDDAGATGDSLNSTVVFLSRLLGLLNANNAELFASVPSGAGSDVHEKKGKSGKKKSKAAKGGATAQADALYHVGSTAVFDSLQRLQQQQTAILQAVSSTIEALQPEVAATASTDKPPRPESDANVPRAGKRSVRAVAFKEPSESVSAASEPDKAVQRLRARCVQLDWVPSFVRHGATPTTAATDNTVTDGAQEKRVLAVEVVQQACSALTL